MTRRYLWWSKWETRTRSDLWIVDRERIATKPFKHQIEKQSDEGSKWRAVKDISKGDETHATWRQTSTVILADPELQSKLTQNRSRTDLKVKLITIKINMQTTQWKPKAKRNMKLKTKPDSGSEEAAGAGERRWSFEELLERRRRD